MEQDDVKTVGTVAASLRDLLEQEDDIALEYLAVSFLSSAITALFYARRRAGLTQAQLAERLHTKQSAIARMEADVSGSVSLRRYAEYARACGVVPLDIELEYVDAMRAYASANPEAPRTGAAYHAWQARTSRPTSQAAENQQATETHPPDALLEGVLESIDTIEEASTRAAVLRLAVHCLTPNLPEPILAKALDAASAIEDAGVRAQTLNALAPKLPKALRYKADSSLKAAVQDIVNAADMDGTMPVQRSLDRPA